MFSVSTGRVAGLAAALLGAAACGGDATVDSPSGGGSAEAAERIEVALDFLDATLCNCLHGCGPGMSGHLNISLTNDDVVSHDVGIARIEWIPSGATIPTYVDLQHPHPQNNLGPTPLAAGATRIDAFTLQLDVTEFEEGAYELRVVLDVEGVQVERVIAEHTLSIQELNPECS